MDKSLKGFMKAAVRYGPGKVICETLKKPILKDSSKVLLKVLNVGICGSDIVRVKDTDKKWDGKIFGHEAVGEVKEIIDNNEENISLKVGDKVAIVPLIPCFKCYFCTQGMYSSCVNYSFIGSRTNGALSEYMLVNINNLIKIPEDENIEKYSLLEPLTVALHAIYKTGGELRKSAVIFGSGTIGLLIYQILNNLALYEIVIADVDDYRLNIAKKLGSNNNLNLAKTSLDYYIKENIDKKGVDLVFEVSGANSARINAIQIIKPGGTVVLVGTSPGDVVFDGKTFELITRKELNITGCWMSYSNPFPGNEWLTGIKILKDNLIDIKSLITHRYKLCDIEAAFNMILDNKEKYCKVIINL